MQFDLPDHAQVLIVVGDKQALPPIGPLLPAAASDPEPPVRGHPKLKVLGIGALAVVAFLVGQQQGLRHVRLEIAGNAGAVTPAVPPTPSGPNYAALAQPSPPPPVSDSLPPAPPANQLPPAFAQQLQQPPVITPPPGAPPAHQPSGTGAFGLEN